jgi:hypothetical protein
MPSQAPLNRKNNGQFLVLVTSILAVVLAVASAQASTYIDINDEIYAILSRLEADGVLQSGLLSIKPLSRAEVLRLYREAERNSDDKSEFIKSLVQELKQRIKPDDPQARDRWGFDEIYAKYIFTNANVEKYYYNPGPALEKEQAFNHNNDGDLYAHGSNYRAGVVFRADDEGLFSFSVNPEIRSSNDAQRIILSKGYAVLGLPGVDVVAGKDAQWWGPGYHGALLMTNNAEPLSLIKLTGPEPVNLPWIFKYLGPFQYDFFASRLEHDRSDFADPFFWGLRIDFKPHPFVEIGLERTGIMGGRGRPESLDLWFKTLGGSHEHGDTPEQSLGDQRAGGDIKLTLPFTIQPVQFYWEHDGEENRQYFGGLPYKPADLYGFYLPRLLGFERIGFRAEAASTYYDNQPDVWYTHGAYTAGYTYDGVIMGHHMGTDSKDLFFELSYHLPEKKTHGYLSYDREKHNISGPVSEVSDEYMASAQTQFSRISIKASCGFARIEHPGNSDGSAQTVNICSSEFGYKF